MNKNPNTVQASPDSSHEQLTAEALVPDISAQPGYTTEAVVDSMSFTPNQPMIQGIINEAVGVEQDLYAVLHAGGDVFGLLKVAGHDPHTKQPTDGHDVFMVTQLNAATERARIMGTFVEGGDALQIGRTHQEGLSNETSRNQFTISVKEGKVNIDHHGTNPTEIVRPTSDQIIQQEQDKAVLGFGSLKKVFARKHDNPVPNNPLDNIKLWSPASKDARQALLDGDPLIQFVARTEAESKPLDAADPNVVADMVEQVANQAVNLKDLLAEGKDKSMTLKLTTNSGEVELKFLPDTEEFFVLSSSDKSVSDGKTIKIQGVTMSGTFAYPNVLAPQMRLAFIAKRSVRLRIGEPGEETADKVLSREALDFYESSEDRHKRNVVKRVGDNQVEFRFYDGTPRTSDFLAKAEISMQDDDGVTNRTLF